VPADVVAAIANRKINSHSLIFWAIKDILGFGELERESKMDLQSFRFE
jgi:hypothetical protein